VTTPSTELRGLRRDRAETQNRETEEQATDQRDGEEFGPDHVDASAPEKDRLCEGDKMG
jgi:hypothetical protein